MDAAELDQEYLTDLVDRAVAALSVFPSLDLTSIAEELKTLLKAIMFGFTIGRNGPTPGQALLGIQYSSLDKGALSKFQRILMFVCSILVPYCFSKFSAYVYRDTSPSEGECRLKLFQQFIERLFKITSLLQLLIFLSNGKFKGLSERFCQIICRSIEEPVHGREWEWDVINRELIWHEFTELLLLFMPLLGSRLASNTFPKLSLFFNNQGRSLQDEGNYCPGCMTVDIQTPYLCVPCGHIYCYYCIASRLCASGKIQRFHCLKCKRSIEAIKRQN